VDSGWGPPGDPDVRLKAPEPGKSEKPSDSGGARPQESPEPPRAPRTDEGKPPAASPALPAGIPEFAAVQPGVSAGLRPFLEGLDWLKEKGYRAALHVRRPGEDDSTDRRELFTRRNITYLSIEVSPQTLKPEIVEQFQKIVDNKDNHPLFVYDRERMLAGGLWYLYFRTVKGLSDEEARRKATALGLKEDENGPHREMWLAIQKYLSDQKR
jgi:protein tyrosine phosphatase (PTP) superfamily phosphohydrolase (DUF442 family)